MKQKISEFLFDIAQTFPIYRSGSIETVIEDVRTYLVGYLYDKEIDFSRAKKLIFDKHEKTTFPTPHELLDALMKSEIVHVKSSEDYEKVVVLTLPNGYKYVFTLCNTGKTLDEIKEECTHKYGECKFKTYPKGTVLIGDKVVLP